MENFKIPLVNFKIREGDVVLEDGCSFDEGKWIEKTTDDFFKGKRVSVIDCLIPEKIPLSTSLTYFYQRGLRERLIHTNR